MRRVAAFLLLPLACFAQQPHEQEIQRALIELDRRSAEFSSSQPLPPQVGQPLHPDPEIARQLRPYERMRMAEELRGEHVLRLPPPVVRGEKSGSDPDYRPDYRPLPLPGGPQPGVDPVERPRPRG